MDNTSVGRLGTLLRQVQLVMSDSDPPHLSTERQDLFNNICRLVPEIGARAKYLREAGEKGPQAAKMWLRKER